MADSYSLCDSCALSGTHTLLLFRATTSSSSSSTSLADNTSTPITITTLWLASVGDPYSLTNARVWPNEAWTPGLWLSRATKARHHRRLIIQPKQHQQQQPLVTLADHWRPILSTEKRLQLVTPSKDDFWYIFRKKSSKKYIYHIYSNRTPSNKGLKNRAWGPY